MRAYSTFAIDFGAKNRFVGFATTASATEKKKIILILPGRLEMITCCDKRKAKKREEIILVVRGCCAMLRSWPKANCEQFFLFFFLFEMRKKSSLAFIKWVKQK